MLKINCFRFLPCLFIIAACSFMMQTTQACAAGLSKAQEEYLKKKEPLVFVSQTHYPPFEFLGPDGDHTGICIDLIHWIATEFGFKAQFTDASFKEAQEAVLSGRADILTSFFYSKKRDEIFDFTKMTFQVPATIFVIAERPDIKEAMDLQGKTIAMQAGDYAQEFLETHNIRCTYIYTQNFAEATDHVIAGKADAIIGDEQIVLYHIFSNKLTQQIKKVGEPLYVGQNCMGLKEEDRVLTDIMNKGIELAREKGVMDQIYKKWLGTPYSSAPSQIQMMLPYFFILLGGLTLLSVLVWVWNLKLREKVLIRTAALSKSEKTLRTILDASPLGIGLGEGRTIVWSNPAMCRMLGYEPEELLGRSVDIVYRDSGLPHVGVPLPENTMKVSSHTHVETQWVRKDGSYFDCRIRLAPFQLENKSMVIAIAEDITGKKQTENRMIVSLKEKEMLLKEIHHRVKNNMQVISSLLSLQANKIDDPKALDAFVDTEIRVQSMAFVHEILYQSDNLSEIRLQVYLDNLVNHLFHVYRLGTGSADIEIDAGDVILNVDHAVPCGLIVTELVTNSLKYAVPQDSALGIRIKAMYEAKGRVVLTIADNGSGLPPDFDLQHADTLGLKLVSGLITDQLEGA